MRNIRQNLAFAFLYNAAGVPIAAGVLYPAFGITVVADRRGRSDVALVGQRHHQRAEAAPGSGCSLGRRRRGELVADLRKEHDFRARRRRRGSARRRLTIERIDRLDDENKAMATMAKLITTVMKSP